ncbi:MAG: HlyD family secretion protein [Pseudomonas sp.]
MSKTSESGEVVPLRQEPTAPQAQPATPAGAAPRRSRRALIAGSSALLIALGGLWWIITPPSSEATEDAYLQADNSTVAPRVRGFVEAVLVRDNQVVKAGDPLIRIDAEEFDAHVASARAELADAQAGVAAAHANLGALDAEERLAQSVVEASETAIRGTAAERNRAATERQRYDKLGRTGAVSQRDVDSFRTTAITAEQEASRAQLELQVARNRVEVIRAQRPQRQAQLATADANVARASALLDLALQDQRHTLIRAPIDGVVGNRKAQPGDYVQPGSRLLTLVPQHALYIIANFKETQTARMQPGQAVTIAVDALPGEELHGRVESLAPGSGSSFALLPFEPGTGNFTKIVQRVPVRIHLDADQPLLERLRPGLSVHARVRLDEVPL